MFRFVLCWIACLLLLSSCSFYEEIVGTSKGTTTGNAIVEITIPPYSVPSSFSASAKLIAVVFTSANGEHVYPYQMDLIFDGSKVTLDPIPVPGEVYTSVTLRFSLVSFTNQHGTFVSISEVNVRVTGASFFGDINDFLFDLTDFVSDLDRSQSGDTLGSEELVDCSDPVETEVIFYLQPNANCSPGDAAGVGGDLIDRYYFHGGSIERVTVPSTGAACGTALYLVNPDFVYDEEVIFAVNRHVLSGSVNLEPYLEDLEPSPSPGVAPLPTASFLFFDWLRLVGQPELEDSLYCRGEQDGFNVMCLLPPDDDVVAPMHMYFGKEHMASQEIFPKTFVGVEKFEVQVVGFGDDADDCSFAGIEGHMYFYSPRE